MLPWRRSTWFAGRGVNWRTPQIRHSRPESGTSSPNPWIRTASEAPRYIESREGVIACHAYRRFAKDFGAGDFRTLDRWLERYVHNWASCDGLAGWLVAGAIRNRPELIAKLDGWTRSKNRWRRRAAIVALLQARLARHRAATAAAHRRRENDARGPGVAAYKMMPEARTRWP